MVALLIVSFFIFSVPVEVLTEVLQSYPEFSKYFYDHYFELLIWRFVYLCFI